MKPISSPVSLPCSASGLVFLCRVGGPHDLARVPLVMLVERHRPDGPLPVQFHRGVTDPLGPERALDHLPSPFSSNVASRGQAGVDAP